MKTLTEQMRSARADISRPSGDDETRAQLGLISEAQLASAINRTIRTLWTWRQRGEGPPFVRVGRGVFYRLSDVQRWLAQQVEGGGSSPKGVGRGAM
jgi:hypothetical protein